MNGYTGKILRINLTTGEISDLLTSDYEEWGGGHGIGSALFFDLVQDKTIDGLDPANVVTIMTSPLTGTMALGASARTEIQGIGVQSYPEWFTRSGVGGRFGPMLKYAGWDGVVIEGKAETPVWLDIRDGDVQLKDAGALWGLDTWKTQETIWEEIDGESDYEGWREISTEGNGTRSTQKPAVLTIGPAGENLCRVAAIIHDAGNGSGQGGFGAVWGSKNLKAISVIGTGSIHVADANALMEARVWAIENFIFPLDEFNAERAKWATMPSNLRSYPSPLVTWERPQEGRPQACMGCQAGCRSRYNPPHGNESSCKESYYYAPGRVLKGFLASSTAADTSEELLNQLFAGDLQDPQKQAADLAQKFGINAAELETGIPYLRDLYKMGVLGQGKEIDCDLPFDKLGEGEFIERLIEMITYRQGIGDDMAEGFFRAAERWGRLEEDMQTGLLNNCHWGIAMHYDPRVSLEWGYGTILGDRDINEHGFNPLYMIPTLTQEQPLSAEDFAKMFADRMPPFQDDPLMLDYSDENMYSEHICKLVAWHRYYGRFWIQSALYCDFQYPDFFNWKRTDQDYRGITGEGEQKFFNAVTGKDLTFAEGIEMGRKIWTLDHAIWTLQGRHRDDVRFADYIYDKPAPPPKFRMPVNRNGQWEYDKVGERPIDRAQFEEFKTRYYELEGWDPQTGWPTRSTLESLGLGNVADELEKEGRLGEE
jgi:aldehyde:ferredoxin oxidoreductase